MKSGGMGGGPCGRGDGSRGMGMGQGMGRGLGRGMGKGRGDGRGRHQGMGVYQSPHFPGEAVPVPPSAIPGPARQVAAVIDEERCSACGFCVDLCPEEAISMEAAATVDAGRCTACGACVRECPAEAISLIVCEPQRPV